MIKTYARLAATMVFVLVVMLVVAPPDMRFMAVGAVVIMAVLAGSLSNPAVRSLAQHNSRLMKALGAILIIGAFGLVAASLTTSPMLSSEVGAGGFVLVFLTGMMLFQLPRLSAQVGRTMEAQSAAKAAIASMGAFDPVREVNAAFGEMWVRRSDLIATAGPWFLAACVLAAGAEVLALKLGSQNSMAWLVVLATMLALGPILLVALIQWTRTIESGDRPNGLLPSLGVIWGWLWRLLIFSSITGKLLDSVSKWLSASTSISALWRAEIVGVLTLSAVLILASPFALGLPALTAEPPTSSAGARVRGLKMAGRKYYSGITLILLPWTLLCALTEALLPIVHQVTHNSVHEVAANLAISAVEIVGFLITALVGLTYITRIYLRGVAAVAVSTF